MDHLLLHLTNRIQETEEAIIKWTSAVKRDNDFIAEFTETDPNVAQIYREWKAFDQEKVDYFQDVMIDLQDKRNRRLQVS